MRYGADHAASAARVQVALTASHSRPSRFHALDADECLVAYVRRLQEAEDEVCRSLYAGGR